MMETEISALCRDWFSRVQCAVQRVGVFDDFLGRGDFCGGPVSDHQELIGLDGGLVLHDAVLWYSDTEKPAANWPTVAKARWFHWAYNRSRRFSRE